MKTYILPIFAIVLLASCSGDKSDTEDSAQSNSEKVWAVSAIEAKRTVGQPTVQLLGNVTSFSQSDIVAKVSGDVNVVHVLSGQHVTKGDVLIELDTTELTLSLEQAEAQLAQAKAAIASQKNNNILNRQLRDAAQEQYNLSKTQFDRISALAEKRNVSQSTLDEQRKLLLSQRNTLQQRTTVVESEAATMRSLSAQRKSAEVALKRAQLDVSYAAITAPFNGIITAINTASGSRVQQGQALLSAFSTDSVEVKVTVPSYLEATLRQTIDNKQPIAATAEGQTFLLDRIGATISSSGTGTDAYFKPEIYTPNLSLGKTVSLTLAMPQVDNIVLLPASALHGAARIFVIEQDERGRNRLKSIDVTVLGQSQENGIASIMVDSAAIQADAQVLTSPLPAAIDGLAVEILQ